MDKKKIKSRNETFGRTIFDPNSFTHFFMGEEDFAGFKANNTILEIDNVPAMNNRDILYSPIRVYFDLTLLCNLRCKTCLNNSGNPLNDELDLEQSIRVIEGLADDSVFDVRFSGGEPTLKEGWDIILKRAKELGLTISLNSNGLYNQNTIDRLIEINPDEISISIDGFRKGNDYLRGKGTFDKATESIRELSYAGCRVTINSVVTSLINEEDVRKLLDFADEFCYDISFFHPRPIGRASRIKDKLLSYDELGVFMTKVDKMKSDYPNLQVRTRSSSLRDNSIAPENTEQFGLIQGGSDGFTRFNIMSNGDLYAGGCVLYVNPQLRSELVLGNIVSEGYSLLNVWRNSKKLQKIRQNSKQFKERCDHCIDYKTKCSGFTLEMELYGQLNPEGNIYCKNSGVKSK
jgi:radical SAM protein with 4Fe4S-binding SPASM domain